MQQENGKIKLDQQLLSLYIRNTNTLATYPTLLREKRIKPAMNYFISSCGCEKVFNFPEIGWPII